MKRFNYFQTLYMSFFSKELYKDIAANWKGYGILYVILLTFISTIFLTGFLYKGMSQADKFIDPVVEKIPEITLKNGHVSISEKQPYIISNPENNKPFAIIDTTGEYTSLADTSAQILVTKNKVFVKERFQERAYDLSTLQDFVLTRELAKKIIKAILNWLPIVVFPFIMVFFIIVRLTYILLLGLAGLLFSNILKTGLNYEQMMRLSAAAITPPIFINIILMFLNISLPFLVWILAGMAYLFLAVWFNTSRKETSAV